MKPEIQPPFAYLALGALCLLLLASCQTTHFSDPLEALSIPPGYRIEGNHFSEILQQRQLLQGQVFLYLAESYHTQNKGENCLVLSYVVNESKGWRPHLSVLHCDSQPLNAVVSQRSMGTSVDDSLDVQFGYHSQATSATVVWENQTETIVALKANSLLLPLDKQTQPPDKVLFYDAHEVLVDVIGVGKETSRGDVLK